MSPTRTHALVSKMSESLIQAWAVMSASTVSARQRLSAAGARSLLRVMGVPITLCVAALALATLAPAARAILPRNSLWGFNIPPPVNPPSELIRKYGYPSEVHTVQTDDGYLLRLDRIPNPGKPAVLVTNQLLGSAAAYLLKGKQSYGFKLHDAGYDVWLGNWRGNGLSVNHTTLAVKDPEFWKFSFHEHGVLDLPAMLDYVTQTTGQPSVLYSGHSMGCTSFFVMCSERPEYNGKIRAAFLMAPVSFMGHQRSPLYQLLHPLENITLHFSDYTGLQRFAGSSSLLQLIQQVFCPTFLPGPLNPCNIVQQLIFGKGQLEATADVQHSIPTGMSVREVLHFTQLSNPKWQGFRKFNFGAAVNKEKYSQEVPPDYDLSKVSAPLFHYIGNTDKVTTPQDMRELKSRLSSLKKEYLVPQRPFGHLDFIEGAHAPAIHNTILSDMEAYRSPVSARGTLA